MCACILLLLLNDKTEKVWTPTIIYVACELISIIYMSGYCHFYLLALWFGSGVPDPR